MCRRGGVNDQAVKLLKQMSEDESMQASTLSTRVDRELRILGEERLMHRAGFGCILVGMLTPLFRFVANDTGYGLLWSQRLQTSSESKEQRSQPHLGSGSPVLVGTARENFKHFNSPMAAWLGSRTLPVE